MEKRAQLHIEANIYTLKQTNIGKHINGIYLTNKICSQHSENKRALALNIMLKLNSEW